MIVIEPNVLVKKDNIIIIKVDLKKTVYLKTPIIENECMARLKRDIFEGPKYLRPLIESISFNMLSLLSINAAWFSLKETIKISKLKSTIKI